MRLQEDYNDRSGMTPTVVMTIIVVTAFVAVILAVVVIMNPKKKPESVNPSYAGPPSIEVSSPIIVSEAPIQEKDSLHPDDLDFWDKYPQEKSKPLEPTEAKPEIEAENDPSTDGRHTLITYADGREEWVLISPYLPKHEYDFTKLVCQSGLMKYFDNGKQISYSGIDVSKLQDYIDFVKVKKAGIHFVMIRVGARGYSTGQLILDEYFNDNIKRATDAGLNVGVYFYSQAINKEEAIEEANYVLENIGEYKLTYPVVYELEMVGNDSARTDALTKAERTEIARAFLDTIEAAGFKTAVYGNKEWFLKGVDLSKLTGYDMWLAQSGDIPDYPYKFNMWQYNTKGLVDGISGYVNLDISFIDYSEK